MSRTSRIVLPGIPHHITQRGNRRGDLFYSDSDRQRFIDWLAAAAAKYQLSIFAYCLMRNHIHLAVIPKRPDSLHLALKSVFTKYAMRLNGMQGWNGYVVQNRFYSSPMDEQHAWISVKYIEQNPVRARIVENVEEYRWSSAYYRRRDLLDPLIDQNNPYSIRLLSEQQSNLGATLLDENTLVRFRTLNKRNLPIGSDDYIASLEELTGRNLRIRGRGRPSKIVSMFNKLGRSYFCDKK